MGLRVSKSFKLGGLRYTWGHTFGKGRAPKPKKTPPMSCGGCLLVLVSPFLLVIGCGVVSSFISTQPKPQPIAQAFAGPPATPSPVTPLVESTPAPIAEPTPAETVSVEPTAVDPFRQWSSHNGKYKIDAAIIGLSGGVVALERKDGKRIKVPVEKLGDSDRKYVERFDDDLVGECVTIADGDTITVLDADKKQTKVRLEGIDAPERRQDYGTASKEQLAKLIFQKQVRICRHGTDKYGRTLGDVFIDDFWVNRELVKGGFAWQYKKYSRDSRLADAEIKARKESLGVWSRRDAIPPWEFRHPPVTTQITPPTPKRRSVEPAAPSTFDRDSDKEAVTGYTATGIPIHTGPRGGRYHYSKNGKKVYEKKKK
jgi:micrococcal nuclease